MYITGARGAQGISANGKRGRNGRKNGNHPKTNVTEIEVLPIANS